MRCLWPPRTAFDGFGAKTPSWSKLRYCEAGRGGVSQLPTWLSIRLGVCVGQSGVRTEPEVPGGAPAAITSSELRTTAGRLESGTGGCTYETARRKQGATIGAG